MCSQTFLCVFNVGLVILALLARRGQREEQPPCLRTLQRIPRAFLAERADLAQCVSLRRREHKRKTAEQAAKAKAAELKAQ